MTLKREIQLGLNNLRLHSMRSLLTVLGMVFGVLTLINPSMTGLASGVTTPVLTGAPVVITVLPEAASTLTSPSGDVVVEFNGMKITTIYDYVNALKLASPGQTVPVVVERGGQRVTLSATLGSK